MKKLVLLVVLGGAAAGAWSLVGDDAPSGAEAAESHRLVMDRLWLDHVPTSERDTVNVFAMLSEHSVGIFDSSSAWRGQYELFRFEANGGEVRLHYPQTDKRETVRAKAERCSEGGMDYCLKLTGASNGVKKYYSREGWEIGGAAQPDAVKQIEARINAAIQQSAKQSAKQSNEQSAQPSIEQSAAERGEPTTL